MDPDIMKLILGGGGVAIIAAISKFISDWRKGRVMKEDTAITRLQRDYDRKCAEAAKAWRILNWFRDHYPRLWAAYMRLPGSEKENFPPTPPPEIDD